MGLQIKALHIGDIIMDWSFLLFNFNCGRKTCIPIISYLITGSSEGPILVDTGVRDVTLFRSTEKGFALPEQDLLRLLKAEGLEPRDIRYILQTHLDIDHTGKSSLFPNARIIIQRKEIAYQAAYGCKAGHSPDLPWFVSNLDRVDFVNGDIELFPGIRCKLAVGHTGGHQHIEVKTDSGKAIMVGDSVYDIPMQLQERGGPGVVRAPGNAFNQALMQDLLLNLQREMKKGSMILPSHSYEPLDKLKLGDRRSDKRSDYDGFPSLDWPPK